jgi:hypothetical protein
MTRFATSAAIFSGLTILAVFLFLILGTTKFEKTQGGIDNNSMSECIDRYKEPGSTQPKVMDLFGLNSFCFVHTANQLQVDEEIIKRDNFVFQRNENVVLLYMVVLITFTGVALAGMQLLASYKLASLGHGELAGGAEISYSSQGASFKSSVVGLGILAMSFAFFLVFVLYVYTFRNPNQEPQATNPTALRSVPTTSLGNGAQNNSSAPPQSSAPQLSQPSPAK